MWHQLDNIMVKQRDFSDVKITRVMRGTCGDTDHRLVGSQLTMQLRSRPRGRATKPRLNTACLRDHSKMDALQSELRDSLQTRAADCASTEELTAEWNRLSRLLLIGARMVLGVKQKRNRDWFDENDSEIKRLLEERNSLHATTLNGKSPELRRRYAELRATVQRRLKGMEEAWWVELAETMQMHTDTGNQQEFYSTLKPDYGPTFKEPFPVRSGDGETLITDKEGTLKKWAEYFAGLLNGGNDFDPTLLEEIPDAPTFWEMDDPPTRQEVQCAIAGLKNNKAVGPDSLPAEVLKYGGEAVLEYLCQMFHAVWNTGCTPQQRKDADIISIYKKKGDRAVCRNSSKGISLLSTAGKVLARVMLVRLLQCVADDVLPESQCGFRRERSTVDMVFVARQLQENCCEQHKDLFMVFIDLAKAFDTVPRPMLWEVLGKMAVLLGIWLCFDRCMMEQMHAWSIWVKSLSFSLWMRESGRVVCSRLFSSTYSWLPLRVLQLGMFEPRAAWLSLTDWMVACSTL